MRTAPIPALLLVVLALAACSGGGGGDEDSDPLTTVAPVEGYGYPVQYFDDLTPAPGSGQRHLAPGGTFEYNSDPPTNGKHTDAAAAWGVSDVAVPKETAVHNLEHAGVVVWYNCEGGPERLTGEECAMLRNQLASIVQTRVATGEKVLMTPYPPMEHRIALTSWQVLDAFDDFDAARVEAFINQFECYVDIENFCG